VPSAAEQACWQRMAAGAGEQMAQEVDWTHHGSIEGGGAVGGDAGER
jgi:hypothetical protein